MPSKIDDDQEFQDDTNRPIQTIHLTQRDHIPHFLQTGINWFGVSHRWYHMQVHAWVAVHHSNSMSTQAQNLCVTTLWGSSATVGALFALGLGSCCCQAQRVMVS